MELIDTDRLYENFKKLALKREATPTNMVNILADAMMLVEAYPHLDGRDKKDLALQLTQRFIADLPVEDDTKGIMRTIAKLVLPAAVDLIIAATKGKLKLNLTKCSC